MKKLLIALILIAYTVTLLAVSATDDFNRANSTGLGGNWTQGANGQWDVASNQAQCTVADFTMDRYSALSWANNQSSEIKLISLQSSHDFGPAVRMAGTTNATSNGYLLVVNDTDAAVSLGSSISTAIYKDVNFTFTQLGSSFNVTWAVNDIAKIAVTGTTIEVFQNGSSLTTRTDSALSSGQPGFYCGSGSPVTGSIADDWAGADIGGGGATCTARFTLLGVSSC